MMICKILCQKEIAVPLAKKVDSDCKIKAFADYNEPSISALVTDSDVLVSWLATRKIIENSKTLRLIQCWGVGFDEIDVPFACQRGISVSNLAGYNSSTVAEYTLCMMLLLARNLNVYNGKIKVAPKNLRSSVTKHILGDLNSENACLPNKELAGKVLSIVGYGSIGQQIALRARFFGMKVLAIKRTPPAFPDLNVEFIGTQKDLPKILERSDFVSLNLPLTKETRGSFGAKEFEAMKPTAYLINSSRGGIVDDQALLSALKRGSIAGAALDVLDESLHKYFGALNNVIVTPHISGQSEESTARGVEVTAENIKRLINGQPILNLVSPHRMY
jgi:D-3-phosphoglycerate dehydrogenase / 2-oxoglutarate reductase